MLAVEERGTKGKKKKEKNNNNKVEGSTLRNYCRVLSQDPKFT